MKASRSAQVIARGVGGKTTTGSGVDSDDTTHRAVMDYRRIAGLPGWSLRPFDSASGGVYWRATAGPTFVGAGAVGDTSDRWPLLLRLIRDTSVVVLVTATAYAQPVPPPPLARLSFDCALATVTGLPAISESSALAT